MDIMLTDHQASRIGTLHTKKFIKSIIAGMMAGQVADRILGKITGDVAAGRIGSLHKKHSYKASLVQLFKVHFSRLLPGTLAT